MYYAHSYRLQRFRVLVAQKLAPARERFFGQGPRFVQAALRVVQRAQVVHRRQRLGVNVAKPLPPPRQTFRVQLLGFRQLSRGFQQQPEVVDLGKHSQMHTSSTTTPTTQQHARIQKKWRQREEKHTPIEYI